MKIWVVGFLFCLRGDWNGFHYFERILIMYLFLILMSLLISNRYRFQDLTISDTILCWSSIEVLRSQKSVREFEVNFEFIRLLCLRLLKVSGWVQ